MEIPTEYRILIPIRMGIPEEIRIPTADALHNVTRGFDLEVCIIGAA